MPRSDLKDELGLEKDVDEPHPEEHGDSGHQRPAKIEVLAIRGEKGHAGEGAEDGRGQEERSGDEAGV